MLKLLFLAYEDFTASHLEFSEVPVFPGSFGSLTAASRKLIFFKADLLVIKNKQTNRIFLTSLVIRLLKILYNNDNIDIQASLTL